MPGGWPATKYIFHGFHNHIMKYPAIQQYIKIAEDHKDQQSIFVCLEKLGLIHLRNHENQV